MRNFAGYGSVLLITATLAIAQQPSATPAPASGESKQPAAQSPLEKLLESKVKAEWEAFKVKDKKAYADLLAEDFVGVEDDNQGQRTKAHAVAEIDRSVVSGYELFALKVLPIDSKGALVTYELTMVFPPKALVRFKRVLVSELWVKHDGQWKERYYQETHVK